MGRSRRRRLPPRVEVFEEVDTGHGRLEKRTVALCRNLAWMSTVDKWPGLSCVVRVTRERTVLNVAFGEDRARHRAKNAAANMTILRHFALNLVLGAQA